MKREAPFIPDIWNRQVLFEKDQERVIAYLRSAQPRLRKLGLALDSDTAFELLEWLRETQTSDEMAIFEAKSGRIRAQFKSSRARGMCYFEDLETGYSASSGMTRDEMDCTIADLAQLLETST